MNKDIVGFENRISFLLKKYSRVKTLYCSQNFLSYVVREIAILLIDGGLFRNKELTSATIEN